MFSDFLEKLIICRVYFAKLLYNLSNKTLHEWELNFEQSPQITAAWHGRGAAMLCFSGTCYTAEV
jgi:hypothetical protein